MENKDKSTKESPKMSQKSTKKRKHSKKPAKGIGEGREIEYNFSGMKPTRIRKAAFIEQLIESLYNIKFACRQVGVDRRTYTRWKTNDSEFERACEEINEGIKDEAEVMLQQKITEKDTASLIFFLKTKCKDRGYIERRENVIEGKLESTQLIPGIIVIEKPDDEEETQKGLGAEPIPHPDKKESEEMPEPKVSDQKKPNDTPQDTTQPRWSGQS